MSHYDLLNLLTASGLASLDDTASSDSAVLFSSTAPLSNTVCFSDAAPLNNTADYNRLSFLVLSDRLTSFAFFDDGDNYRTG